MAVPSLSLTRTAATTADAEVLVLGVHKTPDGPRLASDDPAFASIAAALDAIGATGAVDELRRLPAPADGGAPIALIGLGPAPLTADGLRNAAGSAARQLTGIERLAVALPISSVAEVAAVLEGAGIGAYAYTGYRVGSLGTTKTPADEIAVHLPDGLEADLPALLEHATAVVTAVHTVRGLVNTPPSDLYPETLAAAATDLAQDLPVDVEVLDEAQLIEGGYGGILGVGAGSPRGPRMVIVRYSPAGA
ncbi:MAG TPA: M17 family peptidase N-terminal domain-containing protein, partial [Pseudolysinimonas sp.]